MRNETIDGIGSLSGGEYNEVKIDGIGRLKRPLTAKKITIDGIFKAKAPFTADEIIVDGVVRAFKDIKAKTVFVDGVLKMRRCKLYTDSLESDGIIVCNREINADRVDIKGLCSVSAIYGDDVSIQSNRVQKNRVSNVVKPLSTLYFGRSLDPEYSLVDTIECTHIEGHNIKCKTIRAESVKLTGKCEIKTLYCDGDIEAEKTCKIGKIIGKNEILKKESVPMASVTLTKILNMYKEGKIDADEAEKMLQSAGMAAQGSDPDVSWNDDGKLRIVAYIGRKLLKRGSPGCDNMTLVYEGEALDIECAGNISCTSVKGNIKAGGNVHCGDVDGNIACGGNVHCGTVNGSVAAPGGVHLVK